MILDEIHRELDGFVYYIDNYGKEVEKASIERERQLQSILSEIDKKTKQIDRACEMLECGIHKKEKYLERAEKLERETKALKSEITAMDKASDVKIETVQNAIPKMKAVLDAYQTLEPAQKNRLLKSIISKVEFTNAKRDSNKPDRSKIPPVVI